MGDPLDGRAHRKGRRLNRTVWIARFAALFILLVFAMLMANLYSNLKKIERQRTPSTTGRPAP
jgi:hypothetical protein